MPINNPLLIYIYIYIKKLVGFEGEQKKIIVNIYFWNQLVAIMNNFRILTTQILLLIVDVKLCKFLSILIISYHHYMLDTWQRQD